MKKKLTYILITIFICSVIGALSETLIFNFKPLTSNDNSITEIPYTTQKTNEKTELKLNLNHQYIHQLLIEYSTPKNIDYTIEYTHQSAYNRETTDTFTDIFEKSFTLSATNINTEVSNLTISYNSENSSELQISQIIIDNAFHFNYYRAIFISLSLLAICSLFFFYKDGFRTEKIHIYFAIICSLLGLMVIIAQPAMSFFSWDDQIHFDRVVNLPIGTTTFSEGEYHMSNGNIANNTWPNSTDSYTEHRIRSSYLDFKDNSAYTGDNNSTFLFINKIPYIPMAIGYHTAKIIGLPFTVCFQIGKIFNLLFYVLLMSYAIKTIITGKRLLAVIALVPTVIFSASEYSYDPAVFTGIAIFITNLFNLIIDKSNKTKMNFKTAIIIIASITYACLAKSVYAPFLLLTLFIPKEKFKNIKQARLVKIGFIIITILLGSILLLPTLDGASVNDPRGGETSAIGQASLIITHPADYASIINNTAINHFNYELFSSQTLIDFSYINAPNDLSNFYYIILFLIIFVFLTDNKKNSLTKKERLGFLTVSMLVVLLIWSALYLCFTPVGLTTIKGVQNRYFLPLLLPILLCLQIPSIQNKIQPKYYNSIIFTLITIMMIFIVYQFILVPYNF